ncbi:MAG: tetratricopeptide repeat protein [Acidobacteriota bacterium]
MLLALAGPPAPDAPSPSAAVGDPEVRFPDKAPFEKSVGEQMRAAEDNLRAVLGQEPAPAGAAQAFGELGLLYQAYGLSDLAAACLRNAQRLEPQAARWEHGLGLVEQEAGRADAAAAAFERALALDRQDLAAWVYLGEIRRQRGDSAAAQDAARRALAIDTGSPAGHALLGQAALDRRDFRTAVAEFQEALRGAPDANRLHYLLAMAWRGLGDSARAADELGQAGPVGVRPRDPMRDEIESQRKGERVHLARGKTAYRNGRYAEAAEAFRAALAARPESVEARVDLAAALVAQGERATAIDLLRAAAGIDPRDGTARLNLGVLLVEAGAYAEAVPHLRAAVAALPADAEAERTLGRALRESGQLEDALAAYTRATALDPGDEAGRLGEAETLVRLERYSAARERLEAGLRALPRSGLLMHGLARLLAACPDATVRDGGRAIELAKPVFEAQPTALHAETLAMAYAEAGQCADAVRSARVARDLAAGHLPPTDLARIDAELARFERGAPCRP